MIKLIRNGFSGNALIIVLLFIALNCKKEPSNEVPVLKTLAITNILSSSVISGGDVSSEGSSPVTARGVCWSVKQTPTNQFKDSVTIDGKGLGVFASTLMGLKPGKTYYVRAYATNGVGTGYGNQLTAVIAPTVPTLTTTVITAIKDTYVSSGGVISEDGGSPIFVHGVCWSTRKNPTIANSVTYDGAGGGTYTSAVSGLFPDSTYYLRAYASNLVGTAYGNERSFSTGRMLAKDVDNNYYHLVTIGSQVWMTENLKTTRFRDSTLIPLVEDNSAWANMILPGYCWYDNNQADNGSTYGAIYNWSTVSTGKLCPSGWHVPSDAEWIILSDHLGGESQAGGKLKEVSTVHWKVPNAGATNETSFTALPGGYRTNSGEFGNIGSYGNWWSNSAVNSTVAYYRYLYYGNGSMTKSYISQKYGLSVRCLKN
ncbi:MAG: fibrobacter succinogenes major paralogous domain-containing protein [Prolixibacteraceae bacterium]|nr:fibrobacter succinogenes major paralogous domain-containing protein [Prolixibacteraceae bacterium]